LITSIKEICHSLFRTICRCCTKTERWSVYGGKGSVTGWWKDYDDLHGSGFPYTNVQVILESVRFADTIFLVTVNMCLLDIAVFRNVM